MRSNATHGSAGFANIPGYYVGGKTGTADKIVHGHYSQDKVFTTFMAITPADKPKYLYLVMYDEPQGLPEDGGYHTAAYNAGRITGRLITRVEPLEGVPPAEPVPRPAVPDARAPRAMAATPTRWARSEAPRRNPRPRPGRRRAGRASRSAGLPPTAARCRPGDAFFAARRRQAATASPSSPKRSPRAPASIVGERAPDFGAPASSASPTRARRSPRAAARFYPRQPELHRRRHRHQRQDFGRRLRAADLGGGWASRRLRSARSASSRARSTSTAR